MKTEYSIRRATAQDVEAISSLVNRMASKGHMLPRSKYKIITTLMSFLVAEDLGGKIIGCGAFIPLWTDMGEIMSLAVDDEFQGKGVGRDLVNALIKEGKRMCMPEIITLTYQVDFFSSMGFTIQDKDKFPRKLWRECLECPKLEQCDETAMHLYIG
jgi:amino-acid N-acetyltransferase